jgi:MFS transporter, AAHS family, 4-hydroxybenzoate transporter
MKSPTRINIADVIDNTKVNQSQVGIFILCTACLMMDGFDVQALSYVAPALVQDFKIAGSALGPVFAATNFGFLIGSLLFSMLADKLGRRPVLIAATAFFAILTLITARATTVQELLVLRFIGGIGLGSIIPQVTALVGEYSPSRLRITAIMVAITLGFNGGATVSGFISARLIEAFGWRSIFYIGGILPLLIAGCMLLWLPESMQFLVLKNKGTESVTKWLKRIKPEAAPSGPVQYVVQEENKSGVPVGHLFTEGRTFLTILIWVVNFMNLLNLYALTSWLPIVVRESGYSISTAVLVGTMLQIGGILGTFLFAWLISKKGFVPVLTSSLAVACVAIAFIGQPGLSLGVLTAVVTIAGCGIVGSQPGINALSATSYPTYLRATGVGWGLGIGRIGAIVGPVVGGQLMAQKWSTQDMFLTAALPALVSTLAMICMRWARKDTLPGGPPAPGPRKTEAMAH